MIMSHFSYTLFFVHSLYKNKIISKPFCTEVTLDLQGEINVTEVVGDVDLVLPSWQ